MNNYKCRVSNKPLSIITDFGKQPLGNGFLNESQYSKEYFFNMCVGFCEESKMFQLTEQPSPDIMFHENYAFYSSTSNHMKEHFKSFYESVARSTNFSKNSLVVELGCNDGILLQNFQNNGVPNIGIEPSLNVAKEAEKLGIKTINEFFSEETVETIIKDYGKAEFFLSANVMCHIPNIKNVAKNIKNLLSDTGKLIFEDPYLGDIIEKTSYDQIYDEHVFLFSAHSVNYLFGLYDLELIDLIPQKTHGGSMRYVLAHRNVYKVSDTVKEIMDKEKEQGLDSFDKLKKFDTNCKKSKKDLLNILETLKDENKKIIGYAATSKSTTILNYCEIGEELISAICDTTPIKIGKRSPGKHIPIVSMEDFYKGKFDYSFLFAWNHMKEIMLKEEEFTSKNNRKWITHVPNVKIL